MNSEFEAVAGVTRGLMAGVLLAMFVGLWVWAFAPKRRKSFESASLLPLEEDTRGGKVP
jgi:cbb3-type cytochrome oxidase subunit 3